MAFFKYGGKESYDQRNSPEEWSSLFREVSGMTRNGICFICNRGGFAEILCKPKILPLKSAVLEQLQRLEVAEEKGVDEETTKKF